MTRRGIIVVRKGVIYRWSFLLSGSGVGVVSAPLSPGSLKLLKIPGAVPLATAILN